jgi:hypothetical protein
MWLGVDARRCSLIAVPGNSRNIVYTGVGKLLYKGRNTYSSDILHTWDGEHLPAQVVMMPGATGYRFEVFGKLWPLALPHQRARCGLDRPVRRWHRGAGGGLRLEAPREGRLQRHPPGKDRACELGAVRGFLLGTRKIFSLERLPPAWLWYHHIEPLPNSALKTCPCGALRTILIFLEHLTPMRQLLLALTLLPAALSAQSIFFHFTDGSTVSYPVTEVRSTDFDGGNMRVFLWDGTSYIWSMSSLANYQFNDISTHAANDAAALKPLGLYPNPTSGEVIIGFEVHGEGEVRVDVLDLRGSVVCVVHEGRLPQGTQRLRWDGADAKGQPVASGNYLCRVVQGPRAATKQVIVQR